MNKETFKNHKKLLQQEFEDKLDKFYTRCAYEIAIAQEGEFVQNSFGLIKVDSISYILTDDYLNPVYTGESYLVKEGQPIKMNCESTSSLFDVKKVEFYKPEEFNLGKVINKLHYKDGGSKTLIFDSGKKYTYNRCLGSKLRDFWFEGDIKNVNNQLNIVKDYNLIRLLEKHLNGEA